MQLQKSEVVKFGFLFIGDSRRSSTLYFAGFQPGATKSNAHQVVIAEVLDAVSANRKVAYAVDQSSVGRLDEHELENLCRIAVGQFLQKLPSDNFMCLALPLNLAGQRWAGTFQPIQLSTLV
ncbi:hypothetical protein ACXZ1M_00140 [Duganella sp. PWIR1]